MELKRVDVLGKKYRVTRKFPSELSDYREEDLMGQCFDAKQVLFVNKEMSGEHYWTTLFHEIGHAVMYRNGLRFCGVFPSHLEEIVVETFSAVNYELTKKILAEIEKEVVKSGEIATLSEIVDSFSRRE